MPATSAGWGRYREGPEGGARVAAPMPGSGCDTKERAQGLAVPRRVRKLQGVLGRHGIHEVGGELTCPGRAAGRSPSSATASDRGQGAAGA